MRIFPIVLCGVIGAFSHWMCRRPFMQTLGVGVLVVTMLVGISVGNLRRRAGISCAIWQS